MLIVGCDFHSRFQQIAMLDSESGEIIERRLEHEAGEARNFYAALGGPARVGIEATGYTQWFERMLTQQGHQLWVGDAAQIRAAVVRQQKTDARDARHLLDLLRHQRFPRIWLPSPEQRDVRQLVLHRVRLVELRTRVKNQLQALALNQGVCRRQKLWSQRGRAELESLALDRWAARRRQELLGLRGSVAKVAVARKLAVRLYWMLREEMEYPQVVRVQSSSGTDLGNASSPNS